MSGWLIASRPRVRRGIFYWPTYRDARAYRDAHVSTANPKIKPCIVGYQVGYAIQLWTSGPYVGPAEGYE